MTDQSRRAPVTARRLTPRRLLADVGPALLRLAAPGSHLDMPIEDVVIQAPGETADIGRHTMVLGVGTSGEQQLDELLAAVRDAGAGVVGLKAPILESADVRGLTVVEVNQAASWMHVATTIREQLLDYARAGVANDGVGSELFALANSIYAEIGAPVTIEDRFSALVAWSEGQETSDAERIDTILGRAVTQRVLAEQRARGEFEQLAASAEPVYFPAAEAGTLPRIAIAVRAGTEVLGYIWAVVDGPLDDRRLARLREFAPVVALRLANLGTQTTFARQRRSELTAAVLGGSGSHFDARQLQLGPGPVCVVGAAPRSPEDTAHTADAGAVLGLRRFAETFDHFLTAVHPRFASVVGADASYTLVAWPPGWDDRAVTATVDLVDDFLARTPSGADQVIVVSAPVTSLSAVAGLRAQVDAALRATRHPAARGPQVRTVADAALPVMLLHLADSAESLGLPMASGPLARLIGEDGASGALVSTLTAYFAAAGSAEAAAARLHIHPNTMRYRLRRIREVCGLDFDDADAMLLAQLQLRILEMRTLE